MTSYTGSFTARVLTLPWFHYGPLKSLSFARNESAQTNNAIPGSSEK